MAKNGLFWPFLALPYLALSVLIGPYLFLIKSNIAQIGIMWPKTAFSGLFWLFLIWPYWSLSVLIGPYLVLIKSNMA